MTATTLMTVDDLLRLPDDERPELLDGAPHPVTPVKWPHLWVVNRITVILSRFVNERKLGVVGGAGGFILGRNPDTRLAPDIAFVRRERLPDPAADVFFDLAPDLAIEVMSPSDTKPRLETKVRRYRDAGTALVWVAEPRRRAVTGYAPGHAARTLVEGESLSGGDVLPGFVLPVADIFARP